MKDKLSRVGIIIQLDGWRDFIKGDEYWSKEDEQAYEQIKSLLTPVPEEKVDELTESKANELFDWFQESLDGSYEITLDGCRGFIGSILKKAYDNLREGKEG